MNNDLSFFGVFDGHSGNLASKFLSQHLPQYIEDTLNTKSNTKNQSHHMIHTRSHDPVDILKAATYDSDYHIRSSSNKQKRESGSTAVFSVVKPMTYVYDREEENRRVMQYEVILGNVGDSLGILIDGKTGQPLFITKPHLPTDPQERKRIERHGGYLYHSTK